MAASPAQLDADFCSAHSQAVQKALKEADDWWTSLEVRIEKAEEEAFQSHFDALSGRLGFERSDLTDPAEGSLRQKVRSRVQRLVLVPFARRLREHVAFEGSSAGEEQHVLDSLLDAWEKQVDLLGEASMVDPRLEMKARRKERMGAVHEAQRLRVEEQPAAWSEARGVLEVLLAATTRLGEFLRSEATAEVMARLTVAIPAIVARAMCDWRFQACNAEFQQLESWWKGVRSALQRREELWKRLMEAEGVFVKRVDTGIEELRVAQRSYTTLADFGNAEVTGASAPGQHSGDEVFILAQALGDLRKRLRPIRDSAAWRVVDAARAIQKQMHKEASEQKQTLWASLSREDGLRVIYQQLQLGQDDLRSANPVDTALIFMRRVDSLVRLMSELSEFLKEDATMGNMLQAVSETLETMLQATSSTGEELLAVMDDPSEVSIKVWSEQWMKLAETCPGSQLEAAMSTVHLKASLPTPWKRQLLLLKGLQALMGERSELQKLLSPDGQLQDTEVHMPSAGICGTAAAEKAPAALAAPPISMPPAPQRNPAAATSSPRGGYPVRRERSGQDTLSAPLPLPVVPSVDSPKAQHNPQVGVEAPVSPAVSPSRQGARRTRSGTSETSFAGMTEVSWEAPLSPTSPGSPVVGLYGEVGTSRPTTPSWLLPPWPRPASRPDTPSTACDEADLPSLPRNKYVGGQFVQLRRGGSGCGRGVLPPLTRNEASAPRCVEPAELR